MTALFSILLKCYKIHDNQTRERNADKTIMGPSPLSSGELLGHGHYSSQVLLDAGTHPPPPGFSSWDLGPGLEFLSPPQVTQHLHPLLQGTTGWGWGDVLNLSDSTRLQAGVLRAHTCQCQQE